MAYDYEFLTTETVANYIRSKAELASRIDAERLVSVDEIGDGNLNLVFIAHDQQGRGLCLKQALPYVRMTGEDWPLTPERGRFEADSLFAHYELLPEHVVGLFDYDPERYILAMEDLSDHRVWRGAFNEGLVYESAATAVGRYIGAVAFGTSPLSMERKELAAQQRASVNPELCQITEDLVLTEPSVGADRNHTIAANVSDATELLEDGVFAAAMGRAKWNFMTQGEALIHGDLHTASIMVRAQNGSNTADSVKVFDSEFAFYGPIAYDIGLIWANYCIAAARAYALDEDKRAEWALDLPRQTWQALEQEFRGRWPQRQDPRLWGDALLEGLLHTWQEQAWLFAAAEMSRRIVGAAKTTDIETLPENLREGAARGILRAARQWYGPIRMTVVQRLSDLLLVSRSRATEPLPNSLWGSAPLWEDYRIAYESACHPRRSAFQRVVDACTPVFDDCLEQLTDHGLIHEPLAILSEGGGVPYCKITSRG